MMKNIKKTYYYLKRNGIVPTYYAALERMQEKKNSQYEYREISDEEAKRQREVCKERELPLVSILVPAFCTPKVFLQALLDSVIQQTYSNWELVIADASNDESVFQVIQEYSTEERIHYVKLENNAGISANTNAGLMHCSGEYVALLDHDDLLTKDALYEMTAHLQENTVLVYSDEDKCDGTGHTFFDYHKKKEFNYDLILTNNYICHFTMIKTDVMKQLLFRKEYDGAQDFDLFLRVIAYGMEHDMVVNHVPKVLYHWRSHVGSTSENPQSKAYAYDAGMRAVQDHLDARGISAKVIEGRHVGFYHVIYSNSIFSQRKEVAIVVPKVKGRKYLKPSYYEKDGSFPFEKLPKEFGGYLHRANLAQEVYAPDPRYMEVRPELAKEVLRRVDEFTAKGYDQRAIGMELAKWLEEQGWICIYDPGKEILWKN